MCAAYIFLSSDVHVVRCGLYTFIFKFLLAFEFVLFPNIKLFMVDFCCNINMLELLTEYKMVV